jgi:hypothetical protein
MSGVKISFSQTNFPSQKLKPPAPNAQAGASISGSGSLGQPDQADICFGFHRFFFMKIHEGLAFSVIQAQVITPGKN